MARKPVGDGPANAAERRAVIIEAATALFAKQGTTVTTIRQIADAAGLLSGSLYYYFDSKEDIVEAVLAPLVTDLVRAGFRVVQAHPEASSIYLNDRTVLLAAERFRYLEEVRATYARLWLDVIADGVARGEFRDDVDPKVFFRLASYPIWLAIGQLHGAGLSAEAAADQHLAVLLDGFRT